MPNTPETRYARRQDVHIAYQVIGEGPIDLVLSPGWVSHLDLQWQVPGYESFVDRLAQTARVILFDKRGTGLSDPLETGVPFEERAEDLRSVMDAAGAQRVFLVGYSEGGPLATLFAAAHPERVVGLILYGTLARGSAVPEAARKVLYDAIDHWGEGTALPLFAPDLPDTPAARSARGRLERAGASPSMAKALLDAILAMDITPLLGALSVPTLVLHRDGDWLPVAHAEEIAALIPGAEFIRLSGRNHAPWQGDADSVLDRVTEFITGTKPADRLDRVLATVMFTDIVESTAMAASLGDRQWASLLRLHHDAVRSELARFGGREIDTAGDGFFAVFEGPARAIHCARAIRDAVRSVGLDIRVGIHTGEVELSGDDIAGMTVHIGARIAACAGAGEIFTSRTVADLVMGSGIAFEERGVHSLKGVPGTWLVLAVVP